MNVGCADGIAPAVDPSGAGNPRAAGLTPVPLGLAVSIAVIALVAGAGASRLLHDAAPAFAWMTAIGLCVGLFAMARWMARSAPTHPRFLAALALGCLTFGWLLVLGGESTPRPADRDALGFFTLIGILLAVLAAAVALPVAILIAAMRSGRSHEVVHLRLDLRPQLVLAFAGAVGFLLALLLFVTAVWATPTSWRLLVGIGVALGSPVLLVPVWAFTYKALLSRWRVAQPARAVLEGLAKLRDVTGFVFDEVLCLQAAFGNGRVCQVVSRPGRSTLVVSETISDALSAPQLLAVLAHEAAHVCLNHSRRKIAWGTMAGIAAMTLAMLTQIVVGPFVPRALQFAAVLGIVLPLVMLRGLYDTFVTRRHEAEADEFAVDTAGAQPLVEALEVLGASGPGGALVHNRWTTHSTWERRAARIRAREDGRPAG